MIEETAIDLFAGVGGFGEGADEAGVRVVWAANHWQAACDAYEANHGLKPKCQDLHQANFAIVPRHRIGLASPSCQGHTRARGKERPHHDETRATMWAVVSCAEIHLEDVWVVENSPEVLNWICWPAWKAAMEALGYAVSVHIIDCADHGVPQNRVRAFIILTRSRSPLVLQLPRRDPVTANSIIDWNAPGWTLTSKKCPNTRRRIADGRRRFGDRCVCPYYGSGSGLTGRSIHRPIGTITTRDRWAVVDGRYSRMLSVDECRRFMAFPAGYKLPSDKKLAKHLLGNAVPPTVVTDILTEIRRVA